MLFNEIIIFIRFIVRFYFILKPTYNLQIIPPKCIPIFQLCDVYFYGQVKIIVKRIPNCPDILSLVYKVVGSEYAISGYTN